MQRYAHTSSSFVCWYATMAMFGWGTFMVASVEHDPAYLLGPIPWAPAILFALGGVLLPRVIMDVMFWPFMEGAMDRLPTWLDETLTAVANVTCTTLWYALLLMLLSEMESFRLALFLGLADAAIERAALTLEGHRMD